MVRLCPSGCGCLCLNGNESLGSQLPGGGGGGHGCGHGNGDGSGGGGGLVGPGLTVSRKLALEQLGPQQAAGSTKSLPAPRSAGKWFSQISQALCQPPFTPKGVSSSHTGNNTVP